MTDFERWMTTIRDYHLSRYQDLPNIGLYMDQVVEFVDRLLKPLFVGNDKIITATMINNYVKHRMIEKPIKKKYTRDHIVSIITITILKQTLPISEISKGIGLQLQVRDIERSYDALCDYIEQGLQMVCDEFLEEQRDDHLGKLVAKNDYFLRLIAVCFATKLVTEKYIIAQEITVGEEIDE